MKITNSKPWKLLAAFGLSLFLLGLALSPELLRSSPVRAAPADRPLHAPGDCEVTNTNNNGAGSLRACILGLQPGATITFSAVTFPLANPATIAPTAALPTIVTGNVTIDGSNAGVILSGSSLVGLANGLVIDGASQVVIKGLQIRSFPKSGILLQNGANNNTIGGTNGLSASSCSGDCNMIGSNLSGGVKVADSGTMNNTIMNNYIGINIDGTSTLFNNSFGIEIATGASSNDISGNLISGNLGPGISIIGSGTMNNLVSDNRLGTDPTGIEARGNLRGVLIGSGAQSNVITNNLISGNSFEGVSIVDSNTMTNTVVNNKIGTNDAGTAGIFNLTGIAIDGGAQSNLITGNLISGNATMGIAIDGSGTMSNTITRNDVGTNSDGTAALGNVLAGISVEQGALSNLINENLVSGNAICGIAIHGMENVVSANKIGTSRDGTAPIANGYGLELAGGAQSNVITGNLISGNILPGVFIEDSSTMSNTLMGNNIGADESGAVPLANHFGIFISNGAQANMIDDNQVSFNDKSGVAIFGEDTVGNALRRNRIFGNLDKGIALLNGANLGSNAGNLGLTPPALTNIGFDSVSGVASPGSVVEIYSDDGQQGENFHGTTLADATGQFTFSQAGGFTGENITAISIDNEGSTSEFSGWGAGAFEDNGQTLSADNSQALALADLNPTLDGQGRFNADGHIDAFVVNETSLELWLNDGTGQYSLSQTFPNANGQAVALGDLNDDGLPDVFVGNDGFDQILLNDGNGSFDAGQTLTASNKSLAVALADLDGNDTLDAALANGVGETNQIWLNNGSGSFGLDSVNSLGSGGQAITVGDLNEDNYPDIVIGTGTGETNQVWINDGAGNFSLGDTLGNSDTQAVVMGDLNLDTYPDLFFGNNGANEIWINDGLGNFNPGQTLTDTLDTQAVALGDLNSDGFADAFVVNEGNQANQLWINDGLGNFSLGQTLLGGDSQAVALSDLDNDNDLDVFIANSSTQVNQVYLNQNKVILRTGPAGASMTATTQDGLTTTIEIPTGVLTQNTTLTYIPVAFPSHPITPLLNFAGRAFSLEAEQDGSPVSNPFTGAISLTLTHDPTVPNQEELLLRYWDSMQWADAATTCDPTSDYTRGQYFVAVAICHLTDFGLFGPPLDSDYLPIILKNG